MTVSLLRLRNRFEIKLWRALYALEKAAWPWLPAMSWGALAWLIGVLVGFTWRASLPF